MMVLGLGLTFQVRGEEWAEGGYLYFLYAWHAVWNGEPASLRLVFQCVDSRVGSLLSFATAIGGQSGTEVEDAQQVGSVVRPKWWIGERSGMWWSELCVPEETSRVW